MTDPDRDRRVVEETPPRVERETTIVTSGGGGSGAIVAVVLLLIVAVGLFLYFGGYLGRTADKIGVNVNVETPKVDLPDVRINVTPPANPPAQAPPAQNPPPANSQ